MTKTVDETSDLSDRALRLRCLELAIRRGCMDPIKEATKYHAYVTAGPLMGPPIDLEERKSDGAQAEAETHEEKADAGVLTSVERRRDRGQSAPQGFSMFRAPATPPEERPAPTEWR